MLQIPSRIAICMNIVHPLNSSSILQLDITNSLLRTIPNKTVHP